MSFGLSQTLRVAQLTLYLRELLESDPVLTDVWVEGEVSNCTRSSSGHVYFTLRDDRAALSCVAWRNVASRWRELPREGDSLLAHGRISVYEPQGRYQLYVDLVQPAGLGRLFLEFQALKERLEAEGLFAEERKRPLPRLPQVVGVVTSSQAAALQDIVRTLQARFPALEVLLAPTLVQGPQAPAQIVRALQALDARAEVDVIVLARGGGSLEDLWAFNDESVARAVAACRHPVVSGIGHETDSTIADFVADYRAPTPTAAAAAVSPDRRELQRELQKQARQLERLMAGRVQASRAELEGLRRALRRASPSYQVGQWRQQVDELSYRLGVHLSHRLALWRQELQGLSIRLQSASPTTVLGRGYALVYRQANGALVRSVAQVQGGDGLTVQVADGSFSAEARGVSGRQSTCGGDNGEGRE
ncbi:MAG: exodeoxyribonuclease VII large subunit [Chloroflexi bacterium]|nr:exodeoxyribonuclease VII large subunit [Chloroflexota bacterium]